MISRGLGPPVRDRRLLYATALLRSLGTSLIGVLLGIYLAKLHFDPAQVGLVVGIGLAGAAVAVLLVTFVGDRIGRRRALLVLACTGALGTILAAISSQLVVLAAAAFLGMLNLSSRRRWFSLKTITWFRHSLRIDPIACSTQGFCQGDFRLVTISRMPIFRTRRSAWRKYGCFTFLCRTRSWRRRARFSAAS